MKKENCSRLWLLVCLAFLVGLLIPARKPKPERVEIIRTDTLTITKTDTLTIYQPMPYEVRTTDTLRLWVKDTIFVSLPIETKLYKDSTYTAQVSGYAPKLDFIEVYPKETINYITKEVKVLKKPKKWGLGVNAGYGVMLSNGKVSPAPFVGVGISYNFIRF